MRGPNAKAPSSERNISNLDIGEGSDGAGKTNAEADAEDCCMGLLRREGCAGVAHQIRRHGGDSDAHNE